MRTKDGWVRVNLLKLSWLIWDVKPELRWQWERVVVKGRPMLTVVSPRGVRWNFKLSGGAWLRKSK